MERGLTDKLTECLEQMEQTFNEDNTVSAYRHAASQFEELVRVGVVEKRENNLMSPSDFGIATTVYFN